MKKLFWLFLALFFSGILFGLTFTYADHEKGPLTPNRVRVSRVEVDKSGKILAARFFIFPGEDSQIIQAVLYDEDQRALRPGKLIAYSSLYLVKARSRMGWVRLPFVESEVQTYKGEPFLWVGLASHRAFRPASVGLDRYSFRTIGAWLNREPELGQDFGVPHVEMPWGLRVKLIYGD